MEEFVLMEPDATSNNTICFRNEEDGAIYFLDQNGCSVKQKEVNKRTKWPKAAIRELIRLRVQYDHEFKSTTIRNETIWKKVSENLQEQGFNVSATQCNDKWRYLKGRYTSKKDNMGSKGTGEPPDDFPYFEEMDEFLGRKHNIKPIAVAGSLQADKETEAEDSETDTITEAFKGKRKIKSAFAEGVKHHKTGLNIVLEEIKQTNRDKETNRERRHKEILEARNAAISVFSEKMDALIATFKK